MGRRHDWPDVIYDFTRLLPDGEKLLTNTGSSPEVDQKWAIGVLRAAGLPTDYEFHAVKTEDGTAYRRVTAMVARRTKQGSGPRRSTEWWAAEVVASRARAQAAREEEKWDATIAWERRAAIYALLGRFHVEVADDALEGAYIAYSRRKARELAVQKRAEQARAWQQQANEQFSEMRERNPRTSKRAAAKRLARKFQKSENTIRQILDDI